MSEYKYPYIPKGYYPAVMFACELIRKTGYFNRAIQTAANYYDVDDSVLEKHVRARQNAGKKGKKRGTFKHYRFKGKYGFSYKEESDLPHIPFDKTFKALNKENAKKQLYSLLEKGFDPFYHTLLIDFEINGEEVTE